MSFYEDMIGQQVVRYKTGPLKFTTLNFHQQSSNPATTTTAQWAPGGHQRWKNIWNLQEDTWRAVQKLKKNRKIGQFDALLLVI
jgi:hypothetical protein